jgi:phage terminase small subunit
MAMTAPKAFFVVHYMACRNAVQAAILAGYTKKNAGSAASRLMNDPDVKSEIEKLIGEQRERMLITADEVIGELKRIGFSDIRKAFNSDGSLKNITQIPDDLAASILSFDSKNGIKLCSKSAALELLGKHLKLFTDKHEVSGPGGGAIPFVNMQPLTTQELKALANENIGGTEE